MINCGPSACSIGNPASSLGVQPVGLAVLGVVPRQIRRAPPAEPGRRRAPWRRNQAASGTHALRVGPITPSTSAGSVPSEPWSTDRPGSAATCRNLAGPDVPARSSATTDVVRGATRDIDAEANRHCELPSDDCQGTVDLFPYRARPALPGRRTGPPSLGHAGFLGA